MYNTTHSRFIPFSYVQNLSRIFYASLRHTIASFYTFLRSHVEGTLIINNSQFHWKDSFWNTLIDLIVRENSLTNMNIPFIKNVCLFYNHSSMASKSETLSIERLIIAFRNSSLRSFVTLAIILWLPDTWNLSHLIIIILYLNRWYLSRLPTCIDF